MYNTIAKKGGAIQCKGALVFTALYTMIGFHSIYFLQTVNSQNNTTNTNISYPVEHKKSPPPKKKTL